MEIKFINKRTKIKKKKRNRDRTTIQLKNSIKQLTVILAWQMDLVNYQDILRSFVDLNLSVKVKIEQQLEHYFPENDEQLNNEYHVQVFYIYTDTKREKYILSMKNYSLLLIKYIQSCSITTSSIDFIHSYIRCSFMSM